VVISVRGGEVRVRLLNDGVATATAEAGSGLAGLRERFAAAGGRVDAGPTTPDGFELSGRAEVAA
jgi:two-component system sensor histidine kinase DesK